jgi:putative intracellular protease/amidase
MKMKTCAAFVFDGFADCELALVMAALRRHADYGLETFSTRGRTVTARSGLQVLPQATLSYMSPEDFDLLLLPGGDQWEKGDNLEIFPLLRASLRRRAVVAVGSAVLALADIGELDAIPHAGGDPAYFSRFCPDYQGAAFARRESCVVAGNIITIDRSALMDSTGDMFAVFDTLQEIYYNDHELLDPAC